MDDSARAASNESQNMQIKRPTGYLAFGFERFYCIHLMEHQCLNACSYLRATMSTARLKTISMESA